MRSLIFSSSVSLILGLHLLFPSPLRAQGYPIGPFKVAANQVADNFEQVTQNYDLCKEAVDQARAASTTPNDPAYAAMAKPVSDLTNAWNIVKADADQVAQTKEQFKLLYGSDKQIQPSDPRWKRLNGLKDGLQKQLSTYQGHVNDFVKAENEYSQIGGKYNIGWVKVADLIDPLIRHMGRRKRDLGKWEGIVTQADSLKLEGGQAEVAASLRTELKEYQDEWREVQDDFAAFQKQCAGRDYLFGGPGVPPVTAPEEMMRKMKKMKHRYKKAISKWKTIDPKVVDDDQDLGND